MLRGQWCPCQWLFRLTKALKMYKQIDLTSRRHQQPLRGAVIKDNPLEALMSSGSVQTPPAWT